MQVLYPVPLKGNSPTACCFTKTAAVSKFSNKNSDLVDRLNNSGAGVECLILIINLLINKI
jgi:hypothetical protein